MELKFDKLKPQIKRTLQDSATTKTAPRSLNSGSSSELSMNSSLFPSSPVRIRPSSGSRVSGSFGQYSTRLAMLRSQSPLVNGSFASGRRREFNNPYGRLNQVQSSGMQLTTQPTQSTSSNINTGPVSSSNNNEALWSTFTRTTSSSSTFNSYLNQIMSDIQNAKTSAECAGIQEDIQAAYDSARDCISTLNEEHNSLLSVKVRQKNTLAEDKKAFELVDLNVKYKEGEVTNLEQNSSMLRTSIESSAASVTRLEQNVGSLEQQLAEAPDSEKSAIQSRLDTAKQELAEMTQLHQQKLNQYNNLQDKLNTSKAELLKLKEERVPLEEKMKDSQEAYDKTLKRFDKIASEKEELENNSLDLLNLKNCAIQKYNKLLR